MILSIFHRSLLLIVILNGYKICMKKKFHVMLILAAVTFHGIHALPQLDSVFHQEITGSAKKGTSPKDSSITFNSGVDLYFGSTQVKASFKMPATKFSELEEEFPASSWEKGQKKWGIKQHINFFGNKFYADILTGNLTFTQGISRMKSPGLSAQSPFSPPKTFTLGIQPDIPSWNQGKKPLAAALELGSQEKNSHSRIQLALTEEKEAFASVSRKFRIQKARTGISFQAGLFNLEKTPDSAWWQKNRTYPESKCLFAEAEANLQLNAISVALAGGINESPLGGHYLWQRLHASVFLDSLTLNTSLFACDRGMICADSSTQNTRFQFCINPQYEITTEKSIVLLGILWQPSYKTQDSPGTQEARESQVKAGIRYSSKNSQVTIQASSSKKEESTNQVSVQVAIPLEERTITFQGSCRNEDSRKRIWSITARQSGRKKHSPNISAGFSRERNQDGDKKYKINTRLSISGGKRIKWNLITGLSMEIKQ